MPHPGTTREELLVPWHCLMWMGCRQPSPCRGRELYPPPEPTTSHTTEVFKEKVAKPQAGSCLGLPVAKDWFTESLLPVPGGSSWEMCVFSLWELTCCLL